MEAFKHFRFESYFIFVKFFSKGVSTYLESVGCVAKKCEKSYRTGHAYSGLELAYPPHLDLGGRGILLIVGWCESPVLDLWMPCV